MTTNIVLFLGASTVSEELNDPSHPYLALSVQDYDDAGMVNQAVLARVGGVDQQSDNTASQTRYGVIRGFKRDGLLSITDDDVADLAGFVTYLRGFPTPTVAGLSVSCVTAPNPKLRRLFRLELGDLVTVVVHPMSSVTAVTQRVLVRGIEEKISADGPTWTMSLTFEDAAPYAFFTVGDAERGQLDGRHGLTWYYGEAAAGRCSFTDGEIVTPAKMQVLQDQMRCVFATLADRDAAFPMPLTPGVSCWVTSESRTYLAQGLYEWRTLYM